mmetsp:Transcript_6156/g.23286  ORF Transcript_6156/g.23286 Transcript_6156/m.23286 type:complete len:244 (+) Transcript_6156:689-1420(+)
MIDLRSFSLLYALVVQHLQLAAQCVHIGHESLLCDVAGQRLNAIPDLIRDLRIHLARDQVAQGVQLLGDLVCPLVRGLLGHLVPLGVELPGQLLHLHDIRLGRQCEVDLLDTLPNQVQVGDTRFLLQACIQRTDFAASQLVDLVHFVLDHDHNAVHLANLTGEVVSQSIHLGLLLLGGQRARQVLVNCLQALDALRELEELGQQQVVQSLGQVLRHGLASLLPLVYTPCVCTRGRARAPSDGP